MRDSWIYLNGKLVLGTEASISPYDHGFLYGHGLFETMRAYKGRVFYLAEHLRRLQEGMKVLEWPNCLSADELSNAIYQTLQKNGLQEASVRLTVSRGIGASRPDAVTCGNPTVIIFTAPIQHLGDDAYERGWSLATVNIRRNLTSPLCNVKTANYLDNIVAKSEARDKGANEALLLNTMDHVAEGTMCNIFLVVEGRLITPDKKSGLLPGVTRDIVLQLARRAGITTEERQVYPDELLRASEIFITSSLLEIMPVTMLDGCKVNQGRLGTITQFLRQRYQQQTQELLPII
ncbi:MAG: Aminodeoxychorismate lyase [Pelosinus sp.]|jgi:branched-chain amino acid aminotransferase group I|nr:Aminodeoxychorismate lyase [Pelosinus sp.]